MNENEYDYVPPPLLGEKEEAELWRRYKEGGDSEAQDRLVENYLSLVLDMAARMSKKFPTYLEVQDLISYGSLGLLDAIRKFNPDAGVKFSTYCNRRISGAIMDELRRQDWPSRQLRQKVNLVKRAREDLESRLGRPPLDSEMAESLDMSAEEYEDLIRDTRIKSMVSLDRKWDDNDDNEIGPFEMLPDTRAVDPLSELARAELKEVAMRGLSDVQKQVVTLYYDDHLNLKEIGLALNLSESRVCQIHQQTMDFLREKFAKREVTPFSF